MKTYKNLLDLAITTGKLSCDGDYVVSDYAPTALECDDQDLYQYILMGTPPSGEGADSEAYWAQFKTSTPEAQALREAVIELLNERASLNGNADACYGFLRGSAPWLKLGSLVGVEINP